MKNVSLFAQPTVYGRDYEALCRYYSMPYISDMSIC